jgi:hypothetical protein
MTRKVPLDWSRPKVHVTLAARGCAREGGSVTTGGERIPSRIGLKQISLDDLVPHPLNSNMMSAEYREKLLAHIRRTGRYPFLVVRQHPSEEGSIRSWTATTGSRSCVSSGTPRHAATSGTWTTGRRSFSWPR